MRGARSSPGVNPSKRGRRTSGSVDVPMLPPPEPVPAPRIEVEKPDANMCLKVNNRISITVCKLITGSTAKGEKIQKYKKRMLDVELENSTKLRINIY